MKNCQNLEKINNSQIHNSELILDKATGIHLDKSLNWGDCLTYTRSSSIFSSSIKMANKALSTIQKATQLLSMSLPWSIKYISRPYSLPGILTKRVTMSILLEETVNILLSILTISFLFKEKNWNLSGGSAMTVHGNYSCLRLGWNKKEVSEEF